MTRGIRNNNPLNIRHDENNDWEGKRGVQTDKAFVQFEERVYGYRAAFVLISNYILKGMNTIKRIICRWAPPSDGNNTYGYIKHVSDTTGIGVETPLDFEEEEKMVEIVRSMAQIESGIIEEQAILNRAYGMALISYEERKRNAHEG